MEIKNLIITTPETVTSVSNTLQGGWAMIDVAYSQLSITGALTNGISATEIVSASMSSPSNFVTFANSSFVDFERDITGGTALFTSEFFPLGTYGINLNGVPNNVLASTTLTSVQKAVVSLAISCQNRDYYVAVAVTASQTTFTDFLRLYSIPFITVDDI